VPAAEIAVAVIAIAIALANLVFFIFLFISIYPCCNQRKTNFYSLLKEKSYNLFMVYCILWYVAIDHKNWV